MSDPTFLTLAQWGGTSNGWPQMSLPAVALWVHRSVTNETVGGEATADAIADFQSLDAIGLVRGHGGISYSYAIHPEGVIGEGQGIRRGAHTAGDGCNGSRWGWNPCSFGVVFIGNYTTDTLTPEAIRSFQWLRDKLISEGKLEPGTYPTGGHRDAPGNATACPGDNIEANLDVLRQPYSSDPMTKGSDAMLLEDSQGVHLFSYPLLTGISQAQVAEYLPHTGPPLHVPDDYMAKLQASCERALAGGGGSSSGGPFTVSLTGTAVPQ